MSIRVVLLPIMALFAISTATVLSTSTRINEARIEELKHKLLDVGGCNANICFAIDGSSSIPAKGFLNEKNFVLDAASIIGVDEAAEMAAVQYATSTSKITPLTDDSDRFVLKVTHAKQKGGKTFLTGGINYCFSQLWRRRSEANTIVILGDGINNIGSAAEKRAELFRKVGGLVTVVAAGKPDEQTLLKLVGGAGEHIFEVTSFLDTLALQAIIERFTKDICHH